MGALLMSVRPELVEGPPFFEPAVEEVQGFDKLSPNGVFA